MNIRKPPGEKEPVGKQVKKIQYDQQDPKETIKAPGAYHIIRVMNMDIY
jgi:hypothetical protein